MQFSRRLIDLMLANVIATGKALDPAAVFVGLFTGTVPTPAPTLASDFTLPNATDMPAQAVGTWGGVRYLADGRSIVDGPALVFALPDDDNSFTASGYYLADALTGGNVLAYETFDDPIPLPDEHHSVQIIPRLGLDLAGNYNASVVIEG